MSTIGRRLKRLEQGRIDNCPVCRGQGRYVVSYDDGPIPDGCPACGQRRHIHVRYVDESLPAAAFEDRRW